MTFKKALYENSILTEKPKIFEDIVESILKYNVPFYGLCSGKLSRFKWKENICEDFDNADSEQDRLEASKIVRNLINFIKSKSTEAELDYLDTYIMYGDNAGYAFDVDEQRTSSLSKVLNNQNQIRIDTKYGNLIFEFATRNQYNVSDDYKLAYDDDKNKKIIFFVENPKELTNEDVKNFICYIRRLPHELTHYIDDMRKIAKNNPYDQNDPVAYLNDEDEHKAICRDIIDSFGRYIIKNKNFVNYKRINDINYVTDILYKFLNDTKNNVETKDDLAMFRRQLGNFNKKNLDRFFDYLQYVLKNTFKPEDVNLNESFTKDQLILMFRWRKYVY